MIVTNVAKFRLYCDPEQARLFDELMLTYRDACNLVSEYAFSMRLYTNTAVLNKQLYDTVRTRFNLKAQLSQSVMKTVAARYKSIRTQMNEQPYKYKKPGSKKVFKIKRNLDWLMKPVFFKRPQADLVRNRDYSFVGDSLSIQTMEKRVKVPYSYKGFEHYLTGDWKSGTAKLVKSGGKYFLHISVSKEFPDFDYEKTTAVVGIDRGINNICAIYDSYKKTALLTGSRVMKISDRFSRTRASLQKKGTKGAKRVLKRLSGRENRWMNDVNHVISKTLVCSYPEGTVFGLEELTSVSFDEDNNKASKDQKKDLHSWSFYDLEQKLRYKAEKNDQTVVKINPQYTSQRCPICGNIDKEARHRDLHLYMCESCGFIGNDDITAGMNIYELVLRFLAGEEDPKFEIRPRRRNQRREAPSVKPVSV